jgi:hypothetical protein
MQMHFIHVAPLDFYQSLFHGRTVTKGAAAALAECGIATVKRVAILCPRQSRTGIGA